ncbi:hypothetical protein ACL2XP_07355 [Sodalis sp. RH21]|uniref:hypothetical protein n=1 Tax=unclassified Sodalis (in: enterobacteria) TaxID=2636512 RepID=UPI0039B537A2
MLFKKIYFRALNILKGNINKILSLYLYCKFFIINEFSKKKVSQSASIIISLTTYHKRIKNVFLTLETLMQQNYDGKYEIRLYLSKDDVIKNGGVPERLKKLQTRGLMIFILNENIKSYKKLYYSSIYNNEKIIITADDDVFYPKWWLSQLLEVSVRNPSCIIAYRGHQILFDKNGNLLDYHDFMINSLKQDATHEPSFGFLPTGVSGILYPVKSIYNLNLDKELFLNLCPLADDVWFKIRTILNGFKSLRASDRNQDFILLPASQRESLTLKNVGNNENDIQLKKVLETYPNIKELLLGELNNNK